jgi:hypothetical protein
MSASPPPDESPPEIDFVAFVMSLAASAMIHLGEHDDDAGERHVNLPMAKQTIDLLGLLRDKTRGNLTSEENLALEQVLYDLRLRFLQTTTSSR